jgi:hypothetical protein
MTAALNIDRGEVATAARERWDPSKCAASYLAVMEKLAGTSASLGQKEEEASDPGPVAECL